MKRKQTFKHLAMALTLTGIAALPIISNAQTTNLVNINGFKLGGLMYADYAFKTQSDSMFSKGRKNTAEYNGLPTNYDGFNIRRVYINMDYDVNSRIHIEAVLAHESTTPTGALEILPDNNMAMYLKYANVRYKNIFKGTDLILGQQRTPTFATNNGSEPTWEYRSDERTITDTRRLASSTDMGVGLEGVYNKSAANDYTGQYGYNILYGDNLGAKTDETLPTAASNARRLYADVYYKFFNHLEVQLYGDYSAYNYNWDSTGKKYQTTSSMQKLFVAYIAPKWTLGVEAFQQENSYAADDINGKLGALNTNASAIKAAGTLANMRATTPQGLSIFAHAVLIQGDTAEAASRIGRMQDHRKAGVLSIFARIDFWNPDGNMTDALAVNAHNKGTYQSTENLILGGLDWQIGKSIHIMPNFWYDGFTQKNDATISGYSTNKNGADVVYRLTLYYQIG